MHAKGPSALARAAQEWRPLHPASLIGPSCEDKPGRGNCQRRIVAPDRRHCRELGGLNRQPGEHVRPVLCDEE
eukprot:13969172-Alexandrium_andersonii.AAC.1